LYLDFSLAAVAVTHDAEHFLLNAKALKITNTNLKEELISRALGHLGKQHLMCPILPEQPPTNKNLKLFMQEQYPWILM